MPFSAGKQHCLHMGARDQMRWARALLGVFVGLGELLFLWGQRHNSKCPEYFLFDYMFLLILLLDLELRLLWALPKVQICQGFSQLSWYLEKLVNLNLLSTLFGILSHGQIPRHKHVYEADLPSKR
jgi:hypothetical protein